MIAILSAMREEMQALVDQLQNSKTYTKGKRRYHTGSLFGKDVVLAFSRWGKVAAATTATQVINDFKLSELLFSGVAGAVSDRLRIGDIVIGEKLFQHDIDATPLFQSFEVPLLNKTYFSTEVTRRERLFDAAKQFTNNFGAVIQTKTAMDFGIEHPEILSGDIASGDQFITKKSQINFINSNLSSVLCVEMEGAAVAQVCYEYQIPFSILRIISDDANDNAHIDFEKFADRIAGKYALNILKNYLV